MYRDFLAAGREGLQHIACWTERFDEDLARLEGLGHRVGQSGQAGGADGCFVYFDTEAHPGTVVELSEISGSKGRVFEHIAETARNWDGSNPIRLNVRDALAWEQSLDLAWQHFGGVDVLVNNAGLIHSGRLAEQSLEQIRHMIDVNLLGVIQGLRVALPRLVEQGHGHVVNVGSLASFAPLKDQALYAATKHALRALHHGVVLESEKFPVSFSLVCPGAVDTRMFRHQIPHDSNAVSFASRPLTAEQVAGAIYRAAERRPVEVLLPRLQGQVLRMIGATPFLARLLARLAERQGLRTLAKLRRNA